MNTKKSNLLNWRNKRTVETADPNAKVVLSDDTFVDFSELSTDPEVEKIEEEVEQLSDTVTAQGEQLDNIEDAVTAIEGKIPAEASSQNQLADKDFVNESVSTASADFKGTYNSLQELEQVEADANDYGFVIAEDLYGNTRYDRYKYTEGEGWLFEYSINSVQFSSSQWDAINSGIDDSKVNKLNALPTKSQLDESLDTKANKSEMAVSTNADKTTITLKTGTSTEVINAHLDISGKVDKEAGKGLSTNDYTNAEKTKLGDLPTNAELTTALNTKVDKVSGKGLSSNDYTDSEKQKLGDLPTNAELLELLVTDDVPTAGSDNLVKSGGVASAISGAVDALDATVGSTTVASGKHVAVQIVETNGILTAVLIGEDNIANATDLGDISSLDTQTKANVVSAINELVAKDVEIEEFVDIAQTIIGLSKIEEFDPTKEYTVGDICTYEGQFYIFKSGHTGAWDDTDVDESSFVEWLQGLSDTIETYVGNGKEQVVVSCTTEAQGVSMTGLTLMVYLNGSTTEAEEYTTDSHGMTTFRIPVGYTYRIVYPSVAGVTTPAPETHTASVGQRSVEVRYEVPPAPQVEVLAVNFQKWGENTGSYAPYQGQATITIGGTATTYTADEDGVITVNIPLGTAYTLDIIKPEGLHIMGGSYHKELVAEQSSRVEVVRLSEYLSGVLLTDAAGNDYTFDQFQSLVEQGVLAKGDAKYIHLCTDALLSNAVVEGTDSTCYVSIYEIGKRKYHDTDGNFANLRWCDNNIQFSSIPNNVYQYDGKYRTAQIIAEGIERGFATPAATRLSSLSYTFTNSDTTVITGFNAARGQFDALWNNRTYIDEMLDYVFDGEEYLTLSSFAAAKWSSDQNGIGAWHLRSTWLNYGKYDLYAAVPFYA